MRVRSRPVGATAADRPPPEHGRPEDTAVLARVTVPSNALERTANLMARLVVDCQSRTGRQCVLDTGRYSTRHPLLPSA